MMIVMNHQRLLFLALVLLIEAGQLASAQISCQNNGNFTRNSRYAVNLNSTLSDLSRNVNDTGFYNASAGEGTDRANAMVLCRGDAQLDACRECIGEATEELLRSCPNQKQAIRWDERCMLRYSNATIYGNMESSPMWYWWNPNNATSPAEFEDSVRRLLDGLRDQAANGGSLRKVAAGNESGPDFQDIFALLQCTPDLIKEDCSSCLINAIGNIPVYCDGKRGCRVISPSCTLRFEIYPFYNETRLRELDPTSSLSPPAPVPVPSSSSGKGDGNTTKIVIIVVAIVLSLILAVSAIIWLRRRKTHKLTGMHHQLEDVDEISTAESLQYDFSTIKTATNDFSDGNKLGQGGFGAVYKGTLPNGQEIAVKRLSRDSGQGVVEFKNEVLLLAKLQHRNLVRLLGFAIQGMEKLLIYELVQNASLDQFIFEQRSRSYLDWDRRYKIIGGIARGILYLHEDSRLRIIHRDLKASNILLDKEMNPKIADFGMARLFGQDETQGNTSRVVGTYGYMPPEYIIHGQFSIKSDVFSFGVLVLEIISGRKNSDFRSGENVEDLLGFAWKNWREGTATNVVDPGLRSGSGSMSEMLRCIHIGLLCVQDNAAERPTMASVVIMLSSASISLPLPAEPAFYLASGYTSRLDYDDSREHHSTNTLQAPPPLADHSDHSSNNDVSITDLHPR
ncbi:cysteine-rich receptor-like protein kinase 44 [Salvia miltiorrhiza]|uniref:cysteine-rich receptor-like protein kinase 44 n=1 Tax=Salvia miltiorrhiza TaxID=226208 RepID=UPI0025ABB411|nr:cysteine-rich receptor-like protein kinase 44 [Salvia miltiorrhiza]